MSVSYSTGAATLDGFPCNVLRSHDAEVEVTYVPSVGMVGASVTHRGEELLTGLCGLRRYASSKETMGIPFLHPFANRLSRFSFDLAGARVDLDRASRSVALDPNGLPIHGLVLCCADWDVTEFGHSEEGAFLKASLDFGASDELIRAFPFPHEVTMCIRLADATTTVETTIRPTGDVAVPVSFGYHPYLRIPGVPRSEWIVEMPVSRRIIVDDAMIPTGATEAVSYGRAPLRDSSFDDGFAGVEEGAEFSVEGGGRRIAVTFETGYPVAQIYSPSGGSLICFEPMTAPTNAMIAGGGALRFVEPGSTYSARFSISIAAAAD